MGWKSGAAMTDAEKIDAIGIGVENRHLRELPGDPHDPWSTPVQPLDPALAGIANVVRAHCRRLADDETLPPDQVLIWLQPTVDAVSVVEVPVGKPNPYRAALTASGLVPVERYTPKAAA